MALIVQKFGGTSVGSLVRINQVADIILRAKEAGHDIVVVSSAMSGDTDRLIDMAKTIAPHPDPREYAALVSTGEQVCVALLALVLQSKGVKARSFLGFQLPILTDDHYRKARILDIDCDPLLQYLNEGGIPIVAGFQGVNSQGEITTLGRGGSDTSAVALAHVLKAQECQIYTDVDGVFTADPRIVPQAKCLEEITFDEMIELASLGAKVLQNRAVEFAGKYRVKLRVLSSFNEGSGTLVTFNDDCSMERPIVSGIAHNRHEAKLTLRDIPDEPGIAARILAPISQAGYEIDMIIQNAPRNGFIDFTFTVQRDDYLAVKTLLEKNLTIDPPMKISGDDKIAKLSIVGLGMRSHAGIATKLFTVLGDEGVNIEMISTSEIKISVIIDEQYLEKSVRALHRAFCLDAPSE
jgi:aspartate kinase